MVFNVIGEKSEKIFNMKFLLGLSLKKFFSDIIYSARRPGLIPNCFLKCGMNRISVSFKTIKI